MTLMQKWTKYRDAREGTYEFRSATRYKAVADRLFHMGLNDGHTLLDAGAGSCQFGRYLRERGWRGLYVPVDAVLDGTDLEDWAPPKRVDFVTCIEVLEHLHGWGHLFGTLGRAARYGLVFTVPNPEAVDVLKCDPTHVSVIPPWCFLQNYFTVERHTWYGVPDDSLLAWRHFANDHA
jgi:hypothetical protein